MYYRPGTGLHCGSAEISSTLSFLSGNLGSPGTGDLEENQVITAEGPSAVLGTQGAIRTQRPPQCGLEVVVGGKELARRRGEQECSWSEAGGEREPGTSRVNCPLACWPFSSAAPAGGHQLCHLWVPCAFLSARPTETWSMFGEWMNSALCRMVVAAKHSVPAPLAPSCLLGGTLWQLSSPESTPRGNQSPWTGFYFSTRKAAPSRAALTIL